MVATTKTMAKTSLKNGNRNKVMEDDLPLHHWYQFVLGYPPHLVQDYLEKFDIGPKGIILDPFCGTGTTNVECFKNKITNYGVDANPIAHFAATVKTHPQLDSKVLLSYLTFIVISAKASFKKFGLADRLDTLNDLSSKKKPLIVGSITILTEDELKVIPKDFISEKPLKKVLILRTIIDTIKDEKIRNFFRLSLAHLIVKRAGNIAFGPEIYSTKPKADIEALAHFYPHTLEMIHEVDKYRSHPDSSHIVFGDARDVSKSLPKNLKGKINGVITSPPYPNEKDYTRSTRLETVLLDFIHGREELRSLKENLLRSNSRNIFVTDKDAEYAKAFPKIVAIAEEIEKKRIAMKKTSGFEKLYHKIVLHYFGGMYLHFKNMKPCLAKNAKLAYVVGDQMSFFRTYIPTAELLGDIAESLGYRVVKIELFRTRIATATKMQINENVLILERV